MLPFVEDFLKFFGILRKFRVFCEKPLTGLRNKAIIPCVTIRRSLRTIVLKASTAPSYFVLTERCVSGIANRTFRSSVCVRRPLFWERLRVLTQIKPKTPSQGTTVLCAGKIAFRTKGETPTLRFATF